MERIEESQQQVGEKLIRVLFFTLIISVMNATMFNVVLPTISREFFLTSSQVSWISTSYMMVYAIGSVTYGKLADQYRLKDLLTFGLLFMSLGSVLGLLATEYWMIIAGRVLQAVGASVIPATVMIVPIRYFSIETRGRALGIIASGLALGTAVGPVVAGFTTSLFSWRVLFLISLIVLFTLPFYRKYLDDKRGVSKRIDFFGGFLLAGTVSSVLLAITYGNWKLFGLAMIFLGSFFVRIRSAKEPFIQPSLFKNKTYTIGILISLLATVAGFGIPFILPLMLSDINELSPALIGFVMFPGAISSALLGRTGGKLADSKGNSFLFYLAATSQLVSLAFLSIIAGMSHYIVLVFLVFSNLGQTFMQIAMSNSVSRSLAKEEAGVGMGMFQMLNFMVGAIAMTLFGKALDLNISFVKLNPFLINSEGLEYSNIFVVLGLLLITNSIIFYKLIDSKTKVIIKPSNV